MVIAEETKRGNKENGHINEANVTFVVIEGSAESDEEIDSLSDTIRHSLRTQFVCKKVTVSIQEQVIPPKEENNGMCYY